MHGDILGVRYTHCLSGDRTDQTAKDRLSAYLFEATNDTLYSDAAQLSVDFIFNHMWNRSFVFDLLTLPDCTNSSKPITLNQAGLVEGQAFLKRHSLF